jgi:hypothetical protein
VSRSFPLTFTTMDPNPHVRQPLQSEDDPFQVSESLERLKLDEPTHDDPNPSTPTRSTPPSTQPKVSISDNTLQEVCQDLQRYIQPDASDKVILRSLNVVWISVNEALQEDPSLKTRLADKDEFRGNVEKYGEKQFIELLRDMAKKKNWGDLIENRASFLSSDLKPSDRVLSLAVFFNQTPSDESNPPKSEWSEVSKNGAQSSQGHRMFR